MHPSTNIINYYQMSSCSKIKIRGFSYQVLINLNFFFCKNVVHNLKNIKKPFRPSNAQNLLFTMCLGYRWKFLVFHFIFLNTFMNHSKEDFRFFFKSEGNQKLNRFNVLKSVFVHISEQQGFNRIFWLVDKRITLSLDRARGIVK